jgi:hypothetical protein
MMGATLKHSMVHSAVAALIFAATGLMATPTVNAATTSQTREIPQLLTGVAGTPLTFVVSTNNVNCSSQKCLKLEMTSDNGEHFTTLHLPPIAIARGSSTGDLSELIFANEKDGYALLNNAKSFVWYTTSDGAQTWHRLRVASGEEVQQLIPTRGVLYAVLAHCAKEYTCTDYQLARSSLTANRWTIESLPATLSKNDYAFAAFGPNLWANRQGPQGPVLFTSHSAGQTFVESSAPASVSACELTPMSPKVLWAECPTGNLVSFFYSDNSGGHWTSVSRYAFPGTGGGAFDPVSSSLAFLDFGPYTSRSKDFYAVTDSGHKVTAIANLSCANMSGLVFSNARSGLAICQKTGLAVSTHLIRTSDGGRNWTRVDLS